MTAYDPFDPAVIDDPYPYYARLREESPVARVERLDLWVLSRHADVLGALRDPATFSSVSGMGLLLGGGPPGPPLSGPVHAPRWWSTSGARQPGPRGRAAAGPATLATSSRASPDAASTPASASAGTARRSRSAPVPSGMDRPRADGWPSEPSPASAALSSATSNEPTCSRLSTISPRP